MPADVQGSVSVKEKQWQDVIHKVPYTERNFGAIADKADDFVGLLKYTLRDSLDAVVLLQPLTASRSPLPSAGLALKRTKNWCSYCSLASSSSSAFAGQLTCGCKNRGRA